MTTGTRTTDLRQPKSATACTSGGVVYVGLKAWKSWSGADWPKTYPTKYTRVGNPHYRKEYYYDSKRASMRHRWVMEPGKLKTWFVRDTPRRAWDYSEHPYYSEGYKYFDPGVIFKRAGTTYWDTGSMSSCGFLPIYTPPEIWTANDDYKLASKIRSRVAGSQFNAGIAIAESGQAFRMIGNAARRIGRALTYSRHGNFFAAARALVGPRFQSWSKTHPVANNWLELQYGWRPLLDDAKAGAEFLSHHFTTPQQHVFHVTVRKVGPMPTMTGGYGRWLIGGYTVSKRVKVILKEKNVTALAGLLDPASVAWELLPYSFVIDWFLPIGNWLQARQLATGITATYVTSKFKKWWVRGISNGTWELKSPGPEFWYQGWRLDRTVTDTFAIPLPDFKPLRKALTPIHVLNAVGLLLQKDRKLVDAMMYRGD